MDTIEYLLNESIEYLVKIPLFTNPDWVIIPVRKICKSLEASVRSAYNRPKVENQTYHWVQMAHDMVINTCELLEEFATLACYPQFVLYRGDNPGRISGRRTPDFAVIKHVIKPGLDGVGLVTAAQIGIIWENKRLDAGLPWKIELVEEYLEREFPIHMDQLDEQAQVAFESGEYTVDGYLIGIIAIGAFVSAIKYTRRETLDSPTKTGSQHKKRGLEGPVELQKQTLYYSVPVLIDNRVNPKFCELLASAYQVFGVKTFQPAFFDNNDIVPDLQALSDGAIALVAPRSLHDSEDEESEDENDDEEDTRPPAKRGRMDSDEQAYTSGGPSYASRELTTRSVSRSASSRAPSPPTSQIAENASDDGDDGDDSKDTPESSQAIALTPERPESSRYYKEYPEIDFGSSPLSPVSETPGQGASDGPSAGASQAHARQAGRNLFRPGPWPESPSSGRKQNKKPEE